MPDRVERKAREGVSFPLSEAPYNVVAEMVMGVRFAFNQGFLAGSLEENLAAITYNVDDSKKECLLVRNNGRDKITRELWLRTTQEEISNELRSHLYISADLVSGDGQQMRMTAVLDMEPIYLGGSAGEPQFGLEPESIVVRFSIGNTHFDFSFVDGGGLVVGKSKGEKVVKSETLHCVDKWEKGGRQKLRTYLDPDMVDAPAVVWLRFFKKVLDGEVYEKNLSKLKERISELLVGETSRVKKILEVSGKRG